MSPDRLQRETKAEERDADVVNTEYRLFLILREMICNVSSLQVVRFFDLTQIIPNTLGNVPTLESGLHS